jgi:hypothetical protein
MSDANDSHGSTDGMSQTIGRSTGHSRSTSRPASVEIVQTHNALCDQCLGNKKCIEFILFGNPKTRSVLCWEHFTAALGAMGNAKMFGGADNPWDLPPLSRAREALNPFDSVSETVSTGRSRSVSRCEGESRSETEGSSEKK